MASKAANTAKKRVATDEASKQLPKRTKSAAPTDTQSATKKRAAADEAPRQLPKRAKTVAPADTKAPTAKKPATKKPATKKDKTTEKPAHKAALTNGEPASKKRSSPDPTESEAKRVKVNGVAPKKAAAKPKAALKKVAVKSPVEIAPKLPAINSAPTQKMVVFACGEGSAGELGMGPKKSVDVKRPRLNVLLDAKSVGVVQIATGGMHCVALTHDNKILTWGVNDQRALGRNTDWDGGLRDMDAKSDCSDDSDDSDTGLNPNESTPAAIADDAFPAGTKFVQVAAGDSCSFALTDSGLVYGWGTFRVS
jgi:regulator of chromosome condensation